MPPIKGNTDLFRLQQYFDCEIAEEELTPALLDKLERVKAIYAMMLKLKSRHQIVRAMVKIHQLSQAQAYRDIQHTEQLLGSFSKGDKNIKRLIAENMAIETYKKARKADDLKVMASAVRAYNEATGINQEDPEMPDFEKLRPNLIVTVIAPHLEEGLDQLLSKGAINLNNFKAPVIDIPHEEVEPGTAD